MSGNPHDTRPAGDEYPPYYDTYVSKIPEGTVLLEAFARGLDETLDIFHGLSEERAGHRYGEGKWSMKEVLGHIVDSERVFAYRALRIARGDRTDLPGFDQDAFVAIAGFDRRPLRSLTEEFSHLRRSNIVLFASLDSEELMRRGIANKGEFTARSVFWILAGHERHHRGVLKERYL